MSEFMEVKTSELVGAALNRAVEMALGGVRVGDRLDLPCGYWCLGLWRPSTEWMHGGPLIEKHQIELVWDGVDGVAMWWKAEHQDVADFQLGDTPLIAAMRSIVAAKLGDTVSIPAELVKP